MLTAQQIENLYNISKNDAQYLIYVEDTKKTGFIDIMKNPDTNQFYYSFSFMFATDEIYDMESLSENDVAVYKIDETWKGLMPEAP